MGHSNQKKRIRKKPGLWLSIVLVIAVAFLVLVAVRGTFIYRASIKTQVEYTRALLNAMANQDVENARNEIDAKHNALTLSEGYAEKIYGSDDDTDETEDISEDMSEEDEP